MRCVFVGFVGFLWGCHPSDGSSVGGQSTAVIYEADSREEVIDLPMDSPLRQAARSVAAVIPLTSLREGEQGQVEPWGPTLEHTFELCPGERFGNQRSVAECTAFLIDDNLVATAGHCFRHAWGCQDYAFVFDYFVGTNGAPLRVHADNVFFCQRAHVQRNDLERHAPMHDYAIVELTRRPSGRRPLRRRENPLTAGEPLSLIGASGGLPLKVDQGAVVIDPRSVEGDYFVLASDTSMGASGAPVLDGEGRVVGISARGMADYVEDAEADCYRENRLELPTPGSPGDGTSSGEELYAEEASILQNAIRELCERGHPSQRLCGLPAVCGDAICSNAETRTSCGLDCLEDDPPPPLSDPFEESDVFAEDDGGKPMLVESSRPRGCHVAPGSGGSRTLVLLAWLLTRLRRRRRPSGSRYGPQGDLRARAGTWWG